MMKKIAALLFALLALCLSLSAQAQPYDSKALGIHVELDETLGLYAMTDTLQADGTPFGCVIFYHSDADASDASSAVRPIALLYVMSDTLSADFVGALAQDVIADSFPDNTVTCEARNGFSYFLIDMTNTAGEMNEAQQIAYHAAADAFRTAFADAVYTVPTLGSMAFETRNVDGETITQDIFAGKDLTIINVWATWCNPCLNEMPELAAWDAELPENVQLLFLCQNLTDESDRATLDTVQKIIDKTGLPRERVLLWPEGELPELTARLTAFPTTFFVDGEGNLLDDMIVGATPAAYQQTMQQLLER